MRQSLPAQISRQLQNAVEDWTPDGKIARPLWNRDKTLWTGADEDKWLGWLDIADRQLAQRNRFQELANRIKSKTYTDVVLLGMNGSSLCPEVLLLTVGHADGSPDLHILGSTDPAQVKAIETTADPKTSLYILSSKPGSTLGPNIFKDCFFHKSGCDGSRFIVITDPGSKMQNVAESNHFSLMCYCDPSIGGRYSALSDFGMVPGAVIGIDIPLFLERVVHMGKLCRDPDAAKNPGVALSLAMGTLAKNGHGKITIVTSPAIYDLGASLEQLIVESTGKIGRALIPVDCEPPGPPAVYGQDRTFVYIRFTPEIESTDDDAISQIERAGHPVTRIAVGDQYDLGAEFFRREIAVPVAGAVIGIDPFDQPDVEASKIATRKLTDEFKKTGRLPTEKPNLEADGFKFFTDERNASQLKGATAPEMLRPHLNCLGADDYFALLGYIQNNMEHQEDLHEMPLHVRDRKRVTTCLGFGHRFLHSTGQACKGGPNTCVLPQITCCDDALDLPIRGHKFTLGIVKSAQARSDFDVLAERLRRTLRAHLPADLRMGLAKLQTAITEALN